MEQHDDLSPLAPPNEIGPDRFPDLGTLSPAFLYRSNPVPDQEPGPPQYVYLRPPEGRSLHGQRVKFDVALTGWNSIWEAGPSRIATCGSSPGSLGTDTTRRRHCTICSPRRH